MKSTRANPTAAELLASLAEPVRLRVLRLLEAEEVSVGEVAKVVQLPQSTTSRHLKVLSDSGWLARRSAGTATLFRLVLDDLSAEARAIWIAARDHPGNAADFAEDARRLASVLRERRVDSQAFFGRVAGEWDDVRASLFGQDFTAAALLGLIRRDWVVADLGCGTGNAAELLAPHVERVIAVDRSEAMLGAGRARLAGIANVRFVEGTLERLPLDTASVDATVCVLVLHHVAEPILALREMARVMRRERGGGTALIVDMLAHEREEYRRAMGHVHLGFAPAAMAGLLREAGFADPRFVELPRVSEARGPGLFVATGRLPGKAEGPAEQAGGTNRR